MARINTIRLFRGTRANLNSLASSNSLVEGEPILITDEGRFALALSDSTYETFATYSEMAAKIATDEKGEADGVATLDGAGKIPVSQLPGLALTSTNVVASQAAMLALTAEQGDIAIRSDINKTFAHNGGTAGTTADWSELLTPTDTVLSVNDETGAVTLSKGDIGLGNVDNTADTAKPVSTLTQTALDLKLDASAASSFALNLLDDTNASGMRTTLGLGSLATSSTVNNGDWSGTDLAVTNGGTGASDASTARTNLGLVIGTDVQAYNAKLGAISGVTGAADKVFYFTGASTGTVADLTSYGRTLIGFSGANDLKGNLGLDSLAYKASVNNADWSGTDLSVANGGTGASDATTARTNLSAAGSGAITGSGLTIATGRLAGRTTASTGALEEISVGNGLSLASGALALNLAGSDVTTALGYTPTSITGYTGTVSPVTLKAALGCPVGLVLASNEANTNTTLTTVADVNGNWDINFEANSGYHIRIFGTYYTAATTTGIKFSIVPSGFTGPNATGFLRAFTSDSVFTQVSVVGLASATNLTTTGVTAATTRYVVEGELTFVSGTTSGNILLQWATEVSSSAATLAGGSAVIVTKLF